MPSPGLQALILCGPGSSFPTFTSNPDENPKALLPIANRPMVWYPIDFCYRMGITGKHAQVSAQGLLLFTQVRGVAVWRLRVAVSLHHSVGLFANMRQIWPLEYHS